MVESNAPSMSKRLLIKNALVWSTVIVVLLRLFQFDKLLSRQLETGDAKYWLVPLVTNTTDDTVGVANQTEIRNDRQANVSEYQRKIVPSESRARQCTIHRQTNELAMADLNPATDCLKLTSPSIQLIYPDDADEHFNEIRAALQPWAQNASHKPHSAKGYKGPWIENHWISSFEKAYDQDPDTCLSDIFGPFIPIFLPWTDRLLAGHHRYPWGMLSTLRSLLRPNVPYVTVSQNDEGLPGKNEFDVRLIPNLLIFSAGGYGHIPIPLLKQNEERNNFVPIPDRPFHISYVGSLGNAPKGMRQKMHETLRSHNASDFVYKYHYGDDWRHVMRQSRFSLVPRGFGRSAYHLMEVLQMGLIPIYVYLDDDTSWVPYRELFHEIGFSTNVSSLPNLISELKQLSTNDIYEKERRIETLRKSHFSYEGVLDQIGLYMQGKNSDLRCQSLPLTLTGKTEQHLL
jgi:hypothetical protein